MVTTTNDGAAFFPCRIPEATSSIWESKSVQSQTRIFDCRQIPRSQGWSGSAFSARR